MQDGPDPSQANSQKAEQSSSTLSRPVPPTLLRVYADNQDKRALAIFWIVFFVIIVIVTAVSFALPPEVLYFNNHQQLKGTVQQNFVNPAEFSQGRKLVSSSDNNKLGVMLLNLKRQNQFAVIFLNFIAVDGRKPLQQKMTYYTKIYLHLVAIEYSNGTRSYYSQELVSNSADFVKQELHSFQAIEILAEDGETVVGYRYPVYTLRDFKNESYVLLIQTDNPLSSFDNVDHVQPEIMVVNPKFTNFSIIIRYFFFAASVVGLVLYGSRFRKIPISERILQQKLILALSVLLLMFNDPFYPITVLFPNRGSSYFSVFFVINFILFLIFLWQLFLDRIFYEDGKKQSTLLTWKRMIYIGVTYIFILILYTALAFDHIEGMPIVATQELQSNKFIALEVISLFMVVLGFLYILVQYIRICIQVDQKMWRNQLFMFFSLFFLVVTLIMFFINGFSINDMSGSRILLLFTIMNMYTFYLQYMYSITGDEKNNVEMDDVYHQGGKAHGGFGLLENASEGGSDCVDLEFKQAIPAGGLHFKKERNSENEKGWGYQFGKPGAGEDRLSEIEESDKQTQFQQRQEQEGGGGGGMEMVNKKETGMEMEMGNKREAGMDNKDFDQFSLE